MMCKDKSCIREYFCCDHRGDAQAMVYHPFPGVEVAFISIHMAEFDFEILGRGNGIHDVTIHYCIEGRMEQQLQNEFIYLMPGDCFISVHQKSNCLFQLPLNYYQGICISMKLDWLENTLLSYLHSCGCSPDDALEEGTHMVLRSWEYGKKLFEDFYEVESDRRLEYIRVKLPELFYRMKYAKDGSSSGVQNLVSRSQAEMVKSVSDYITENLNRKITMNQLTRHFGVSDTFLQNAFRNVYGMPVIRFIRMEKMQRAARILIQSTCTIDEIAAEFGYENESKFAAAFKKIMGESPGVYRKAHSKVKIL